MELAYGRAIFDTYAADPHDSVAMLETAVPICRTVRRSSLGEP
jgi:hypothetical protein